MSKFTDLQSQHEKLIKDQASQEIQDRVQQYIEDVRSFSSQIPSARERDQLRANLRYWASYIYEKTGTYPNVELAPSAIPPRSNRGIFIAVGIILALLALVAIGYWGFAKPKQFNKQVEATKQALETQQALSTNDANILTATAAAYPNITNTPRPTPPPEATTDNIEPTQVGAISIQITSVQNGDRVFPITVLRGNYSNLPAGYSIHMIIQPMSKGDIYYPMKQYATVSANYSSGDWSIEGGFGQGQDLKKTENYKISMVAAINDEARNKLAAVTDTGFQKLPDGVIQFPQTVIVSRVAYSTMIDGIQVIYSSYLDDEGNYEIFSINPDGSDEHRITFTSGKNEIFPSLSPNGKQIVYVVHGSVVSDSIEIINSDNTSNEVVIPPQGNLVYERPRWSSDGLFVAYAVGTPQETRVSFWSIYVYDMQSKKSFLIAKGETDNRYFSWIPHTHDIIFDARLKGTNTSGFVQINIMTPEKYSIFYDGPGEEIQPAVSPDGTHLAYSQVDNLQNDNNVSNIYVLDKSTGKITQLTTNEDWNRAPVWNPDGISIYFESTRYFEDNNDGHYCIWSINADGTHLTPLSKGKDRYPYTGYMYALIPSQP